LYKLASKPKESLLRNWQAFFIYKGNIMYGETPGFFSRLTQRFQPTPTQVVTAELKDAELAALSSQSEAEYAALRVKIHTLTAEYHNARALRLKAFLSGE
jgi:hypothetical protein